MLGFYNYTVVLTYIGAASGVYGIMSTLTRQSPRIGIICLMLSGLCDMFDGAVAKTRKRTDDEKRFGIQIDSLADLICFGVLPACIGYAVGLRQTWHQFILIGYALAALIRLAYFNVMEENRQKREDGRRTQYDGLPVTCSALIFPFIYVLIPQFGLAYLPTAYGLTLVMTAFAFLATFKVKKLSLKGNILLVFLVVLAAILLLARNVVL